MSNEENPFYGITWEDISGEPTPLPEKNPTNNALDRFTTDSNEIPWTPWVRHSQQPGDRYAKLTIHRTPTKPMEMYTSDQQVAVQLMKSNNDWPLGLSCSKCSAKFHTRFSLTTHMGGHR